jgi:hypothetical protein
LLLQKKSSPFNIDSSSTIEGKVLFDSDLKHVEDDFRLRERPVLICFDFRTRASVFSNDIELSSCLNSDRRLPSGDTIDRCDGLPILFFSIMKDAFAALLVLREVI